MTSDCEICGYPIDEHTDHRQCLLVGSINYLGEMVERLHKEIEPLRGEIALLRGAIDRSRGF